MFVQYLEALIDASQVQVLSDGAILHSIHPASLANTLNRVVIYKRHRWETATSFMAISLVC